MRKKYLYISLFIVSIVGLSVVQYQYFRIGLNLAGIQFNQKVGASVLDIKEGLSPKNELTFLVGTAITQDESNFNLSLDSVADASVHFMDDYLKDKLLQHGIKTDFSFDLYDQDSTEYLISSHKFDEDDKLLKYPIVLEGYLPDLLNKRMILEIQFHNVNRYFLSQLNGLTIPSLVFIIVIIFIIVWVFRSFYLQKSLISTTNEFINNLTHELKTPVFSIGVATKILQEKAGEEQQVIVKLIRTQVDKLKNQIDKVLELAIIEGKRNFIEKSVFDLKPVILSLIEDFEQVAQLENFSFTSEVKGDGFMVYGEAYHLENAINSLLENAKKYSTEAIKILLLVVKEDHTLVISVKDNGIGIKDADQKKIFDKYYRVSNGDIHNVKGYGLGLNYVKRIVMLHKGKIKLKSKLGEGSTFIIRIPLKKV